MVDYVLDVYQKDIYKDLDEIRNRFLIREGRKELFHRFQPDINSISNNRKCRLNIIWINSTD